MARKSNAKSTDMDKGTFFFAMKCASCHPGDQAVKYDRNGYRYWDDAWFGYQYAIDAGKYTGPIVKNADGTYSNVKLDGDYGFVVPPNRLVADPGNYNKAVPAPWNRTGVIEADCLLCHSVPRTDARGNNLSWMDRSAALGAKKFSIAPNATMGWTDIVQCERGDSSCDTFPQTDYAKNMMPMNFPPTMANLDPTTKAPTAVVAYTDAAGNLKPGLAEVDVGGGVLALALDDTVIQLKPSDMNCQGCHAFPDIKKSGKLWMPGHPQMGARLDAHFGKLGCVDCHPSVDGVGHNLAKGDATIGTVRNDLDNLGFDGCKGCHDTGKYGAPDPMRPRSGSVAKANHTTIPGSHFSTIACQSCHIPYVRWAFHPAAQMPTMPGVPMPIITDVVYDMATSGTQLMYPWAMFLGDDALDPSVNTFQMGMTPATYAGSYKWFPALKKYKGKLTTVKAALSAWFGEWLPSPQGDLAIIKPLPLRLVRKALTGSYGQYTQAQTNFDRVWIQNSLVTLKTATDIDTGTTFVSKPVLVKAGLVYYLDDSDNLHEFVSAVAESHDFGLGHEVVPLKSSDPANSAGPYGTGGCADCHSPSSTFFYGQQLADFDFEGQGPKYEEHYRFMGYSDAQVAQLAGAVLTVRQVDGVGAVVSAETGKWYDASQNWVDAKIDCGAACSADFSPPKGNRRAIRTVALTATPPTGYRVKAWTGCTAASRNACSVTMDATKLVYVQYEPDAFTLTLIATGTGSGTIESNPTGTPSCVAGVTPCNTSSWAAATPSIALTATAAAGSKFSRWLGCPSASGNTCTVTTNAVASGSVLYAVFDHL